MNICQSLLLHPHCKEFLEDLLAGDDSWVLYDNATQHAVWIPRGDEPPAIPKPDHHSHRFLPCYWWDTRGMLYWKLLSYLWMAAQGSQEVNENEEICHPYQCTAAQLFFTHVMHETGVHITWPVQLKIGAKTKKDPFVKIYGSPEAITQAKEMIGRTMQVKRACPLLAEIEIPPTSLPAPLIPNLLINPTQLGSITKLSIRASESDDILLRRVFTDLLKYYGQQTEQNTATQIRFYVEMTKEMLEQVKKNGDKGLWLECEKLGVAMQIDEEGSGCWMQGSVESVLIARRIALGMGAAALSFDCAEENAVNVAAIENEFGVSISTRRRGNAQVANVNIRSAESRLLQVLQARETMFGLSPLTAALTNEYSHLNIPHVRIPTHEGKAEDGKGKATDTATETQQPKSPDPNSSPLATSIINGARQLDSSGWTKKQRDREEMLTRARMAMDDEKGKDRYPTDMWSGYGLSCSLPSDLLKGLFDLNAEEREKELPSVVRESSRLCIVKEEDELTELSNSLSSASTQSSRRIFDRNAKIPAFAATTSGYERLGDGVQWDIRLFNSPSMVLAQLGCSEYVTQLREQEV
ncbi:hypothetical protein WR25_01643 [Diploscapter pachys]|uniref:BICC1 first type I KH domain-containing protein n=1 Tax=Diploscapter pachys TaxID=2018661 RepID=A0A2A2JSJ9_9BILA|nr:hypothetical protein WR25_01643 [Diploscapter pachys]